jgi:D-alanine-D-alanine ligase
VVPCHEFYDYSAKYLTEDSSKIVIPADIPAEASRKVREYAVRAFKACGCAGMARVDFFLDRKTGKVLINEVNTIPGFTSISMYAKLWAASGVEYPALIERLVSLAIERWRGRVG